MERDRTFFDDGYGPPSPYFPDSVIDAYLAEHPGCEDPRNRAVSNNDTTTSSSSSSSSPSSSSNTQSNSYPGVNWHKQAQKWRGITHDVMAERSLKAKKTRPKQIYTKYYRNPHECYLELEKIRSEIKEKNVKIWTDWASKDPLTSNIEMGPADIRDAERGKAYWVASHKYNYLPTRAVVVSGASEKFGLAWKACCKHVDEATGLGDCSNLAQPPAPGQKAEFCMSHGGRCPHGSQFYCCRVCQQDTNKTPASLCKNCKMFRLDSKRTIVQGGNGLCTNCEQHAKQEAVENGATQKEANKLINGKRWEDVVFDDLIPLIKDEETGFVIPYESRDDFRHMLGSNKRTRRGECETEHQRRPDLWYLKRSKENSRILCSVHVEVDENCHVNRETECELGKMDDTYQSIVHLAQTEGKSRHAVFSIDHEHLPYVYTFKFNPNEAGMGSKSQFPLKKRIKVLAQKVNSLLNKPDSYFTDELTYEDKLSPAFETLYYKPDNKHLLEYKRRSDEGWDWKFYGNSHP